MRHDGLWKQNLILIGGGGHCKSVLDTLLRMGFYQDIYILDPALPSGKKILEYATVLGGDELLLALYEKGERNAFITVGSIQPSTVRSNLYSAARNIGFTLPDLIDPGALVSSSVHFGSLEKEGQDGAGIFVGKGAIINADTYIGNCSIINTSAVVEHECKIGDFTHISVHSTLCGQVSVGDHSFIGAGSTVIQGIKIGSNVLIGAGSLVLRNVEDGEKVMGIVK